MITCSCVILIPHDSASFHKLRTSASSAPTGLAENSTSRVKPYFALLANGCTGISTYELPVINNWSSTQPLSLLNEKLYNCAFTGLSSWS